MGRGALVGLLSAEIREKQTRAAVRKTKSWAYSIFLASIGKAGGDTQLSVFRVVQEALIRLADQELMYQLFQNGQARRLHSFGAGSVLPRGYKHIAGIFGKTVMLLSSSKVPVI